VSKQIFGFVMVIAYTEAAFDLWMERVKKFQETLEYDIISQGNQGGNHGEFNRRVFDPVRHKLVMQEEQEEDNRDRDNNQSNDFVLHFRHKRSWSKADIARLKIHSAQNSFIEDVVKDLGRTKEAIKQKAYGMGLSISFRKNR
jgi:hypothetical protein